MNRNDYYNTSTQQAVTTLPLACDTAIVDAISTTPSCATHVCCSQEFTVRKDGPHACAVDCLEQTDPADDAYEYYYEEIILEGDDEEEDDELIEEIIMDDEYSIYEEEVIEEEFEEYTEVEVLLSEEENDDDFVRCGVEQDSSGAPEDSSLCQQDHEQQDEDVNTLDTTATPSADSVAFDDPILTASQEARTKENHEVFQRLYQQQHSETTHYSYGRRSSMGVIPSENSGAAHKRPSANRRGSCCMGTIAMSRPTRRRGSLLAVIKSRSQKNAELQIAEKLLEQQKAKEEHELILQKQEQLEAIVAAHEQQQQPQPQPQQGVKPKLDEDICSEDVLVHRKSDLRNKHNQMEDEDLEAEPSAKERTFDEEEKADEPPNREAETEKIGTNANAEHTLQSDPSAETVAVQAATAALAAVEELRNLREEAQKKQEEYEKARAEAAAANTKREEERKRMQEKIRARQRATKIKIVEIISQVDNKSGLSSIDTVGYSSKFEEEKNRIQEKLKARRLDAQRNKESLPSIVAGGLSKPRFVPESTQLEDYESVSTFFSIEELRKKSVPNLDYQQREKYLSNEDFQSVFGCSKAEFAALPGWKRTKMKRSVKLF